MNTTDKIINELAVQLANKAIEQANYKIFYDEAQEKLVEVQKQLVEVQAQLEQAQTQLEKVNKVLEKGEALKELFDEVANKLEEE
ncbi:MULTISPECIES: hypothetical protein [unclassified Streptococcus]|uniref:hypothetical protein n=1 Tax=unclassified Streptococcus TaxID=2608887 RepID=UPI0010229275|nr:MULTISPECIES: hypothetical protein [unclassified Streptococcus]MTQ41182.1 hypothetical protein [Streptococcus sp. BIOML-A1]RYS60455.1 hypothetical protein EAI95_00445 [Streptococcus sp. bf_0095]